MQSISVVVLTANDLVRRGVETLMKHSPREMAVSRSFCSIQACQQYLKQSRGREQVQVLLLDDGMPATMDPLRMVQEFHKLNPLLRIVMLSGHLSGHYVQNLLQEGATGFLYKEDRLERMLVAGILAVVDGDVFLSPQVQRLPPGQKVVGKLNTTDLEVLGLMAQGLTAQEISARLGVVDRTVYRVRGRLRQYLRVRTNEQVVEAARRRGLLHVDGTVNRDCD